MKFHSLLPVLAVLLLIACQEQRADGGPVVDAYGDSARRADSVARHAPPAAVGFSGVLDKANNGRMVIVEGYLALPSTSMISGDNVQLALYERPNQLKGAFNFIVNMPVGEGSSTMKKIPLKYKKEDVRITGAGGETILIGDHVKITGRLTVFDQFCSIACEKIEKLGPVKLDYTKLNARKLTPANPGDSTLDGKLVYAEGMIGIPVLKMSGNYTFVYLEMEGGRKRLTVDIAYGNGPAQIEIPGKEISKSRIRIRDSNSRPVDLNRKVRVYGMWDEKRVMMERIENI